MTKTYAVADLHGRADLLLRAIDVIEENAPKRKAYKVVFLGDYVDRGPDSHLVITRLMRGPEKSNASWICLMGNHEELLLGALESDEIAETSPR